MRAVPSWKVFLPPGRRDAEASSKLFSRPLAAAVSAVFCIGICTAQQVGPPRGENVGDYNVMNSFETGYRWSVVNGDLGKYRSDVNYLSGIRLLGSNLTVNSREGHGRFFDEIVLTTQGLGNDPYQSVNLRIQKNSLYRYDMLWRLNAYYNPGLTVDAGHHFQDTQMRLQDHDFILFPQAKYKLRLGYSRNSQTGPALSTVQQFDARGSEFTPFADIRQAFNEYRLGGDVEIAGFKLTLLHRWTYFKEDTEYSLTGRTLGDNPAANTALTSFSRSAPYHGSNPGWLVNLLRSSKRWAANGRFVYSGGRGNFALNEVAVGSDRFNSALNRQVVTSGNASRPFTTADLAVSFFPTDRLTVVNNSSFYNLRIDGTSAFSQFDNATLSSNIVNFRFFGIRTFSNATDANFRVAKWFGIYAGYRYSTRLVRTVEGFDLPPAGGGSDTYEQTNHLHSGVLGIRLRPFKPLTVQLEGEIGRADRPFTPVSERNYEIAGARADYRTRKFTFGASYRQNYNANSVTLSTYSSHARNAGANFSWSPRDWLGFDAQYAKIHLDTVAGIAFFAGAPRSTLLTGLDSVYVSNIHAASAGVRFAIRKWVDVFTGYAITRDTGDGRATALPPGTTNPVALLAPVQTYPLNFQSPYARVSIRITQKLRWNAAWQYYGYHEDFGLFGFNQNYRANTGYTSLLWSF